MTRLCYWLTTAMILLNVSLPCAGANDNVQFQLPATASQPFPRQLSDTNLFLDLRRLIPHPALRAYEVNVPFWSDGAEKARWILLPAADSHHAIEFSRTGPWRFAAGTTFIKHFDYELPTQTHRPSQAKRLETRILIMGESQQVFGATYRWSEDQADATLVTEATEYEWRPAGAAPPLRWWFPGPNDCAKCHVKSAGSILGVNTLQLNRMIEKPDGSCVNQLQHWNDAGLFEPPLNRDELGNLPAFARLNDERESVEMRARSWLDVNCGYCHRPGGVIADFDARFATPLTEQKLINVPVRINFGIDRARFIAPRDPWRSLILRRTEASDGSRMPPLGHTSMDSHGAELLRSWIAAMPGPDVLAPPRIVQLPGATDRRLAVALQHDHPDSVIHFTLDGTVPTQRSAVYRKPLEILRSTTVRARAYKHMCTPSITVHETFIIQQRAP